MKKQIDENKILAAVREGYNLPDDYFKLKDIWKA